MREALDSDLDVLLDCMLDAFNWTGETRFTRAEMLANTHSQRYLGGWRRPTDFGFVAHENGEPVGAVWARPLTSTEPGYGYVADDIPEIGMAVSRNHRGRKIGTELLSACTSRAGETGWNALSLSVEDGNVAARRLYESVGFVVVGRNGSSDTMLLYLARRALHDIPCPPTS